MANFLNQNQSMLVKREFGNLANGSLPSYGSSSAREFSATANRFGSMGMVIAGDSQRIQASIGKGKSNFAAPKSLGRAVSQMSGPNQNTIINSYKARALSGMSNKGKVSFVMAFGITLVYGGLDFPGARTIRRQIQKIIAQPESTIRIASVIVGGVAIAWANANRDIT
jgi:uncharacterized protein YjeT (DUF2065 family)